MSILQGLTARPTLEIDVLACSIAEMRNRATHDTDHLALDLARLGGIPEV